MPTKKDDDKKLPKRGAKKAKADAGDAGVEGETSNVVELRQPEPTSKKPSGRKQQLIPGTEPPSIPEIDETIALLSDAKDARQKALDDVRDLEAKLLMQIDEHKLEKYLYQDGEQRHYVGIDETRKLKHRRESAEQE